MAPRASSLVLAMDIGSSSLRTALFTDRGERILTSTAARQYAVEYTREGGATLNPLILLRAARGGLSETLRAQRSSARLRSLEIRAVGGSAFWHSLLGLDRAGKPLTPIFTWADFRSAPDAAKLRRELSERRIQLRTGCMLRAPYWPATLRWLRRTERALFQRVTRWVSPSQWIFREVFGADLTSHSMASGTGLYNLTRRTWDEELCARCFVRSSQLGSLSDSTPMIRSAPQPLREALIFPALGDGAASNLGAEARRPGRFAINVGTSAAVREIRPNESKTHAKIPAGLFCHVVDETRVVVGGAISNAGNLRRWSLRELRLNDAAAEKALSRVAAANDSVTILPNWVDERAPSWPEDLRGMIYGFSAVTSAADILRATTASTFYRLAEIFERLHSARVKETEVVVSGGVLHSPASLRILADALGCDLRVCAELESSLRGAAVHALEKLGYRVPPLSPGRMVRHSPALAAKHRARRLAQGEMERTLTRRLRKITR